LVTEIWSEGTHHYRAVVEGSIPYDVEFRLGAGGDILRHSCDCPYDWGEYCKHEVAVMFAIRKHLEQDSPLDERGQKRGLRALVQRQSKDDLVNLLCTLAKEYDCSEELYYHLQSMDDES
jgi:uncharacterized Zn finger protein